MARRVRRLTATERVALPALAQIEHQLQTQVSAFMMEKASVYAEIAKRMRLPGGAFDGEEPTHRVNPEDWTVEPIPVVKGRKRKAGMPPHPDGPSSRR